MSTFQYNHVLVPSLSIIYMEISADLHLSLHFIVTQGRQLPFGTLNILDITLISPIV